MIGMKISTDLWLTVAKAASAAAVEDLDASKFAAFASAIAAAVSAYMAHRAVNLSRRAEGHSNEERAHHYLEAALSKLGGDPGAVFLLEVKADARDFVHAGQLIRLAIKAAPHLAWARIYRVGYLFHQGGEDLLALAESEFALKCSENAEERVLVLNQRGILFARLGHFEQAEQSFDRALREQVYRATTWLNRAWAFRQEARYEEAVQACEQAIQASPHNRGAYHDLAALQQLLGEPGQATRTWVKLGHVLLEHGGQRDALGVLLSARASGGEVDDWCDLEGKLLFLAGEVAAAEPLLRRAKELGRLDSEWDQRLGSVVPGAKPAFPSGRRSPGS